MLFDLALYRRVGAVGLGIIAAAGLILVSLSVFGPKSQEPSTSTSQAMNMDSRALYECIEHTNKSIKLNDADYYQYERIQYERIWLLCGNQVYNQMVLADYAIRREKLVRQEFDERVTLWMVVSITVSGVILAGLQLLTSYRLASSGRPDFAKESEVVIQRDRISLKSSITGVLILGISLAFFIVYVLWIYTVTETKIFSPPHLSHRQLVVSARRQPGPKMPA